MLSLNMVGQEFDQVAAAAEHLKFELENFGRSPAFREGSITS
jgi:hypothetical protein